MASARTGFLDAALNRLTVRRWTRAAGRAQRSELGELRRQRHYARMIKAQIDRLFFVADSRLALPRIGSNTIVKPLGTDWSWRPPLWRGPLAKKGIVAAETKSSIGDGVTLFHDCRISELTLRQLRNTSESDLAPFGLRMDVFRFDGSFLSLVVNLPDEACAGLQRRHILRLEAIVELEKTLEVFARLNIRHGPNTEQIVREMSVEDGDQMVEFDLAYTNLNEKRVDKMWIDLIFEGPEMNQVTLRDLTLCRYPRAEL